MEVLIEYGEEQEIMESFRGNKRTAKGYQKLLAGHVHDVGMKRTYNLTVEQVHAGKNQLVTSDEGKRCGSQQVNTPVFSTCKAELSHEP